MSVTSQIAIESSHLRRWLDSIIDGVSAEELRRAVNNVLAQSNTLVVADADLSYVGTGYNYSFYAWAEQNAKATPGYLHSVFKGYRYACELIRPDRIQKFLDYIKEIHNKDQATDQELASFGFMCAIFDRMSFRRSRDDDQLLQFLLGEKGDVADRLPEAEYKDILSLIELNKKTWSELTGKSIENAPSFSGSVDAGGAVADWISDGTLYECKCVIGPTYFRGSALLQAIVYYLLDYYDVYAIKNICWHFPRQDMNVIYPAQWIMEKVFGKNFTSTSKLRMAMRDYLQFERNKLFDPYL